MKKQLVIVLANSQGPEFQRVLEGRDGILFG